MKCIILLLLMLVSMPSISAMDKLSSALSGHDETFYLIPGFFLSSDEKKRYFTMAQKKTAQAFQSLNSTSIDDLANFVKGTTKIGLSGLAGALLYAYYKGYIDISLWAGYSDEKRTTRDCKSNDLPSHYRVGVYTGLGIISAYLFAKGTWNLRNFIAKEHRLAAYKDALALEAFIQRVPIDPGECGKMFTLS